MEPIFDRNGRTVGWLHGDVIYDRSNRARAFVQGGAVYTYHGNYLGRLDRGFFRDRSGHAVASMAGAQGGPLTPPTERPPSPPVPSRAPLQPRPSLAPLAPMPSLSWSGVPWEVYLGGA
jgi:hypothetical protein